MFRLSLPLSSHYRWFATTFGQKKILKFNETLQQELASLTEPVKTPIREVKHIAEVVKESAIKLNELQSIPPEKRKYQFIQGSVSMPFCLINRLEPSEISTSDDLFNFVIRNHDQPFTTSVQPVEMGCPLPLSLHI